MAEKKESSVKLPEGWVMSHEAEPQALKAEGAGVSTVTVKPGVYVAQRREGGTLIEQHGDTPEQLVERIEAWDQVQPRPNPSTEDGNRVLSDEEKIESGRATVHHQITQGARVGAYVDLTPVADPEEAKGAFVSAAPPIETEEVEGEQATGPTLISGPQSTAAAGKSEK